jgi:hypothetical protein
VRRWVLDERFETLLLRIRRFPFALGNEQALGIEDDDDTPRRHHRQRGRGINQILRFDLGTEQAVDAEGTKPFVHHLGEFGRDRRLLAVVISEEHIQRTGVPRGDLFLEGGSGGYRHFARSAPSWFKRPRRWR